MANETELRDRWGRIYHDSAEYQTALKRDAVGRSREEASARDAMRLALRSGDSRKASAIQQQLLDSQARARTGSSGGEAEGLDAYQNQRVTDYIAQATQDRAKEYASPTRSFVDQGPQVPDFANAYPYASYHPSPGRFMAGGVRHGGQSEQEPPDVLDNGQPAPTPAMIKQAAADSEFAAIAAKRKEDQFVSSLPKELKDAYPKLNSSLTPDERSAFWNDTSPEARYSKLRYVAKNGSSSTPGVRDVLDRSKPGVDSSGGYTERGSGLGMFIGTGGVSPMPRISRPITVARPNATVLFPATPNAFNFATGATNR